MKVVVIDVANADENKVEGDVNNECDKYVKNYEC